MQGTGVFYILRIGYFMNKARCNKYLVHIWCGIYVLILHFTRIITETDSTLNTFIN